MKKRTFISIIVALSMVSLAAICTCLFMVNAYYKFKKTVNVKADGITEATVSVSDLSLTPSQSKEYEISLVCDVAGKFSVELDYEEKNDGGMKDFVDVSVYAEGECVYEGGLADLLQPNSRVVFNSTLHAKTPNAVKIVYAMPAETGNEAKNTSATFDISVRIYKI
ncbi:MAG: hypothetical protein ACI4SH_02930 [Candidatus Scatosoma sp.]